MDQILMKRRISTLVTALLAAQAALAQLKQIRVYDNMAELLSATNIVSLADPPRTQPYKATAFVKGYYTPGDMGGGTYNLTNTVASTNAYGGRVQITSAYSWDLQHDGIVRPEQFGAKGDGSFDDTHRYTNALRWAEYNVLKHRPSAHYIITNTWDFPANGVTVDAYGSTITTYLTGNTTGPRPKDRTKIRGGKWYIESLSPPAGGYFHDVFHIGVYAGEVSGVSGGTGYQHIEITGLEDFDTTHTNANGIFILGDSSEILLENNRTEDTATLARPYALHWGGWHTAGTYSVGDTRHPHNVRIINNSIGKLTCTPDAPISDYETTPLFISGSYNIVVDNLYCEQAVTGTLLYAGDVGFRWARTNEARMAFAGYRLNGIHVDKCTKYGVLLYGLSLDTSPLVWNMPIKMSGCSYHGPFDATLTGSTDYAGISLRGVHGATFEDFVVAGFEYGVSVTSQGGITNVVSNENIKILRGSFNYNNRNGIKLNSSTHAIDHWKIRDVAGLENGQWASATAVDTAGIYIGDADNIIVDGSYIGNPNGETKQQEGIRVDGNSVGAILLNNYARGATGVDISFSIGSTPDIGLVQAYFGNVKNSAVANGASGSLTLPAPEFPYEFLPGDGNASINVTPGNQNVIIYNDPLTATRGVAFTFVTSAGARGRRIFVVRTANATDSGGPWVVNVGGAPVIQLSVKDWCIVETTGAVSPGEVRLIANGTLP